jgi:hypothetical protein
MKVTRTSFSGGMLVVFASAILFFLQTICVRRIE